MVTVEGSLDGKIFLFVAFAIGMGVAGYLAYQADRKRRRLLRAWARSQGLTMHAAERRGWEREYPALKVFDQGSSRHSELHLTGEVDGRPLQVLDYRYTTGSGKNRKTHRRAITILGAGSPTIPLVIRREHVFDRVGEFFGLDDIDFELSEFSRRFHVSSADRKWAYDVIHPQMMDYLMTLPPVTIAFGLSELAIVRPGSLQPTTAHQDLKIARRLLDLVPQDVLAQLRGETR